jgi:hypothetical protein
MKRKGGKLRIGEIRVFIESTYKYRPDNVGNYILDKDLTTKYTTVYFNPLTNHGVVSNRPTNVDKDFSDIISDVKAALNIFKNDQRFISGWNTMDNIRNKYGLHLFSAIGYSLGAIVLENYEHRNEFQELIYVSKPVLPVDIITDKKLDKKSVEIRSKLDATSLLKPLQDKANQEIVIDNKTINPIEEHKIKNIFPRIDENLVVGYGLKDLKKMKVKELKDFIKKHRKGKANEYKLTGKNKKDLIQMAISLLK